MNGWHIVLLFAVVCGGMAGAFVRIIHGNLMLVLAWRQFLSFLLLIPMGLYDSLSFNPKLIIAGLIHTVAVAGFYLSCHLTKLSHTYLLANMSPVMILIYSLIIGHSFSKKTYLHLTILLAASALLVSGFNEGPSSIHGDLFAIFSACGFAGICLFNKRIKEIPPWNAIMTINAVSAVTSLALSLIFQSTQLLSTDPLTGFLGLFTAEQFPINLLNAVLTGIFCASLISLSSRHLEPMIVTTALLFEPLTATFCGWLLNIEKQTSLVTWILMLVIINSLFQVLKENSQLEERSRVSVVRLSQNSQRKEQKKEGMQLKAMPNHNKGPYQTLLSYNP